MNPTHSQVTRALAPRHTGSVEWEELPALAPRMLPMDMQAAAASSALRAQAMGFNTAWGITMPAHFDDAAPQSAPFHEAIRGLATREVDEPELFRHFFG